MTIAGGGRSPPKGRVSYISHPDRVGWALLVGVGGGQASGWETNYSFSDSPTIRVKRHSIRPVGPTKNLFGAIVGIYLPAISSHPRAALLLARGPHECTLHYSDEAKGI